MEPPEAHGAHGSTVLAEVRGAVGLARLNRPEARNALSPEVMETLAQLLEAFDADPAIRCVVVAGGDEVFAAGADIKAMRDRSFQEALVSPAARFWPRVAACRTPLVAAVSGYALGAGCELALACDMIVASETARFGQPEINVGLMPGAGGTQRLTRTVGKYRAMEMVLTGRPIDAREAERHGLVNRVVAPEQVVEEAKELGRRIAEKPPISVQLAKRAVLKALDAPLTEGVEYERQLFYFLFGTEDAKEGVNAFVEKRKPEYKGR